MVAISARIPDSTIMLRGRMFTQDELLVIGNKVKVHYDEGRTVISRKICEELNWRQPNGWLKDRACREVLIKLSQRGMITLPKSRKSVNRNPNPRLNPKPTKSPIAEIEINEIDLSTIRFQLAKGRKQEAFWNSIVDHYHYLGQRVTVGKSLKYLIYANDTLIGCIGFSSPAKKLSLREAVVEKALNMSLDQTLSYCINNSRFLIFPFVKVKNLASKILSASSEQIVKDWESYYSIKPVLIETFVQISKFEGTCYKAANWVEVGTTRGYSKKGTNYVTNNEPKKIFLYGLNSLTRKRLASVTQ